MATHHVALDPARPSRTAGFDIPSEEVARRLEQVGCVVEAAREPWTVTPPPWRPDIVDPADLDEEVIRLVGYDRIPSVLPQAPRRARPHATGNGCGAGWGTRWPTPATSRRRRTRSSGRRPSTP